MDMPDLLYFEKVIELEMCIHGCPGQVLILNVFPVDVILAWLKIHHSLICKLFTLVFILLLKHVYTARHLNPS